MLLVMLLCWHVSAYMVVLHVVAACLQQVLSQAGSASDVCMIMNRLLDSTQQVAAMA
jgi:hypothetical protein